MKDKLRKKRIAVLGLGKMAGILVQALLQKEVIEKQNLVATVRHPERARLLSRELGFPVGTDNAAAARKADVVLLGVKPQTVGEVCEGITPVLERSAFLISIAASVPTAFIEAALGNGTPVVRAMPNTPCQVDCGMTGICSGRFADAGHLQLTRSLFDAVGRTVVLDEKHMNAVTGLSASGPAFVFIILESLAEAGVKVGLPRDVATLLAAQTVQGAARMVLQTGHHPALLKDSVTTPAGCTIDGILELEEGKLRVTLIKAVVQACHRAQELLLTRTEE